LYCLNSLYAAIWKWKGLYTSTYHCVVIHHREDTDYSLNNPPILSVLYFLKMTLTKLKETRKLYSSLLGSVKRPDRIRVILNSIDEDIEAEKSKLLIMAEA